MKKIIHINKALLILIILFGSNPSLFAQQSDESKSTEDLSFLIGKWNVARTYNPNSDNQRILNGTLFCQESLDGKFINCTYEINRPGKIRGLDVVYFNYNSIYNTYESMWLSSTWPIKVLMQGTLQKNEDNIILITSAQFQIENNVTEYVKGELVIGTKEPDLNSFTRKTLIRTSNSEEGAWHHHMTETANRIDK
jgi:hypothetical protein